MIDPQSGDGSVADEFEQQAVRRVENLRQFHPDRGQIVDVKKAAVIDFFRRHAPEGEPIGLIVQQSIEPIETARDRPACH